MSTNDNLSNTRTATDEASKRIDKKMGAIGWNMIEQACSDTDLKVQNSLILDAIEVTKGKKMNNEKNISKKKVFGEIYEKIRPKLVQKGLVPKDIYIPTEKDVENKQNTKNKISQHIKNKKKRGMNADEIRENNALVTIEKILDNVLTTFNLSKLTPQNGFQSEYVEIIGLTFTYIAKYILANSTFYSKKKYFSEVLTVMVALQRFRDVCKTFEGIDPVNPRKQSRVSKSFVGDMIQIYKKINKQFPFDGIKILKDVPELLVRTKYDDYIPQMEIMPRDHQKQIIRLLYKNYKNGVFLIYNAMIGLGKTTTVVSLAEIAHYYEKTLLCVCNLKTVQMQMASLCYNSNIKFAIGSVNYDGSVKITNHYNCKKESDRRVIICGPEVAYQLLTDKTSNDVDVSEKYILFHDEPTIGSDIAGSKSLESNVKVMMNYPKWTIFSSATSPAKEKLQLIINRLKMLYPLLEVDTIYSSTIQIGCDVRTFEGELVVPYLGCTNSEQLKNIIKICDTVPFLGRLLTHKVALHLYNLMQIENIKCVPDIPSIFKNVVNMKADHVRVTILDMLSLLATCDNAIIKRVCMSSITDATTETTEMTEKNDDDTGFEWENENIGDPEQKKVNNDLKLDLMLLGTTEPWDNMTIIATDKPIEFAIRYFDPLIQELNKYGTTSVSKLISKYQQELRVWQSTKDKILRNKKVSDLEKSQLEDGFERDIPKINFPNWGHIGSKEHALKFNVDNTRVSNFRYGLTIEAIKVKEMNVPDIVLLLLMTGVGIYSSTCDELDHTYTESVLQYASQGKLAYIVADNSISFGTNLPVSKVIVTPEFSKMHSLMTLIQLMGRAGRVGQSCKAEARISKETAQQLIDFAIDPDKYNVEMKNIENMMDELERKKQESVEMNISKMEEDLMKELNSKKEPIVILPNMSNISKSYEQTNAKEKPNNDNSNKYERHTNKQVDQTEKSDTLNKSLHPAIKSAKKIEKGNNIPTQKSVNKSKAYVPPYMRNERKPELINGQYQNSNYNKNDNIRRKNR